MQLVNTVVNEEEKLSAVLQVVCGQLNDPAAGRAFEPMFDRRLRAAPEPKESVE